MPFRVGAPELIILLVIILIIFGVGKLPQIGNAIGKTLREFRQAQNNTDDDHTTQPRQDSKATQAHKNGQG